MSAAKCTKCGGELPENVKFCVMCGTPIAPAKSYETNITPIGTELLFTPGTADVYRKTEVLSPDALDTNDLPTKPGPTGKVSEPATDPLKYNTKATTIPVATDPLKHQTKETSIPTAAIKQKSPMALVALAAVCVLAIVGAAAFYFSSENSSNIAVEPVPTPTPIFEPAPSGTEAPVNSATPAQIQAQTAAPSPSVTNPKAPDQKASEPTAEIASAKIKPTPESAPAPAPAPVVAKSEAPPALSAAEYIQRGLKARTPSAALAEYQSALKADPANKDVHYLMGLAYQQLGQTDQAFAAYRKCTSGPYAAIAAQHVKKLEKDSKKSKY